MSIFIFWCENDQGLKVVLGGYHRIFFGVKVKTVHLIHVIGGRRYLAVRSGLMQEYIRSAIYVCPNHTDDGIHLDHGYLGTLDNLLGPP